MIGREAAGSEMPRILDFPGYEIFLERQPDQPDDHLAMAETALDALFGVLPDDCRPLAFELMTSYCDEWALPIQDPRPASPYRLLRSTAMPEHTVAKQLWTNPAISESGEVSRTTAGRTTVEALAADGSGLPIGFEDMLITATMVRIPPEFDPGPMPSISAVDWCGDVAHYPIESIGGERWISGTQARGTRVFHSAPIETRVSNAYGDLSLTVSTCWSIWMPGSAGYPALRTKLHALLDSGWSLSEYSSPVP